MPNEDRAPTVGTSQSKSAPAGSGSAVLATQHQRDPAIPVAEAEPKQPNGRLAQRQRRARILATVRMLIATGGIDQVTLRTLAEASNISVQTIYNLVGNRMDVVEAAISQHITTVAKQHRAQTIYPNSFVAIGDMLWGNLLSHSGYSRNVIAACSQTNELRRRVYRRHANALRQMLHRRYHLEAERFRVDLEIVAIQVTSIVGEAATEWADGAVDDAGLRYRLNSAYGLAVGGLVSQEERMAINKWLDQERRRPSVSNRR